MVDWPKSDGRTFLAHAFAFFCLLEWGYSFEELDAVFDPTSKCGDDTRRHVLGSVQNFGRVIQEGRIETYARPIGGGTPRLLPQSVWELDDFSWRFGTSAINPADAFNRAAEATHWIFVDTDQFDTAIGLVQDRTPVKKPTGRAPMPGVNVQEALVGVSTASDRYLRKADVLKLVPMSRSTLDDRVRRGLVPASIDLGGGIIVWWESEVQDWMRTKGGRSEA